MKKCFIICPIGSESSPTRKRSNQLLNHILKPICDDLKLECVRVDKISSTDDINQTIIDNLENSDLAICDLTEHNPNVFYEAGYRKALGLPIIFIKDSETKIPFDISTVRTIDYKLTDLDDVQSLKSNLKTTINSILDAVPEKTNNKEQQESEKTTNKQFLALQDLLFEIRDKAYDIERTLSERSKDDSDKNLIMMEKILPMIMQNPKGFNEVMESLKNIPKASLLK